MGLGNRTPAVGREFLTAVDPEKPGAVADGPVAGLIAAS